MRSRTEAAFAVMFDGWGWCWDYEPHDLAGYIPDFDCDGLLVEIKGPTEDVAMAMSKIEVSGWSRDAVVLAGSSSQPAPVGKFWTHSKVHPEPEWGDAMFFRCLSCGGVSVCAEHSEWVCHLCGEVGAVCHVNLSADWATAKNATQWRAP